LDIFAVPYAVKIPDVQAMIDENEEQRRDSQKRQPNDFFANFQNYGTMLDYLQELATAHPDEAEYLSVGQSYSGDNIYALKLGEDPQNPKHTFVVQCGIHAREWISPSTCFWIIDQLLNKDPDGGKLLDDWEWLFIPVLNIDGYDYTHTQNRLWRKNRQPNIGSSCIGTDLNRNYAYGWSGPGASGNPCSDTYYGSRPFSGPETQVIQTVLQKYVTEGRLESYFDIHSYGGLWMSPWGYSCSDIPIDYPVMDAVMKAAVDAVRTENGNSYAYGPICRTIYQASGGSTDYSYGDGGAIHSYALEAYGSSFTPAPSQIPLIGQEIYLGLKATCLGIKPNPKPKQ